MPVSFDRLPAFVPLTSSGFGGFFFSPCEHDGQRSMIEYVRPPGMRSRVISREGCPRVVRACECAVLPCLFRGRGTCSAARRLSRGRGRAAGNGVHANPYERVLQTQRDPRLWTSPLPYTEGAGRAVAYRIGLSAVLRLGQSPCEAATTDGVYGATADG